MNVSVVGNWTAGVKKSRLELPVDFAAGCHAMALVGGCNQCAVAITDQFTTRRRYQTDTTAVGNALPGQPGFLLD